MSRNRSTVAPSVPSIEAPASSPEVNTPPVVESAPEAPALAIVPTEKSLHDKLNEDRSHEGRVAARIGPEAFRRGKSSRWNVKAKSSTASLSGKVEISISYPEQLALTRLNKQDDAAQAIYDAAVAFNSPELFAMLTTYRALFDAPAASAPEQESKTA